MDLAEAEDGCTGRGLAGKPLDAHVPPLRRRRQFGIDGSAFGEQAHTIFRQEALRQLKQAGQGCQGSGREHVRRLDARKLGAQGMHGRRSVGQPRGFPQERRLALVGFDQVDMRIGDDCQHEAGKSGAGAEIDKATAAGWKQRCELGAIVDVPRPQALQVGSGNQIDFRVPFSHQSRKRPQPRQRGVVDRRLGVFHVERQAARERRAHAAKMASAAGVMPSMRAAAASESGAEAASLLRNSADMPPTVA